MRVKPQAHPQRQTNDNCPLRHSPTDCYIVRIRRPRRVPVVPAQAGTSHPCPLPPACHSSEGWNPGEGEGSPTEPRIPTPAPQRQTNDNCPLRHSPADCYIVRIRRPRRVPVVPAQAGTSHPCPLPPACHSSEGWNPGEGEGSPTEPRIPTPAPQRQTNDNCPLRHSPTDCYIVRIRRPRRVPVVPAQAGTSHPCPLPPACHSSEGWNPGEGEGSPTEPRIPTPAPQRQTNDNCPLRHSPTDCYIVRIRRSRTSGNLARCPFQIPSPSGRGLG